MAWFPIIRVLMLFINKQLKNNNFFLASTACTSPIALGMQDGTIKDRDISASSWLFYNTDFYGPQTARLNDAYYGPWVKHENDISPWIQVYAL